MKFFKFLLFILIVLAIAAFAGSPYYTAYQLKQAYDARDGDALVSFIDFEQLQPNITSQLTAKFSDTLTEYPLVAQLGGDALSSTADEFIQSAVTKAITAENISNLVETQGQANQATKELAAAWAIASNKVDLQQLIQQVIAQKGNIDKVIKSQIQQVMTKQSAELEAQAQSGNDSDKPKLNYCGINCFTISGDVKGYPLTVEMARDGLINWQIVDVELP